jgi:hypothetical protein
VRTPSGRCGTSRDQDHDESERPWSRMSVCSAGLPESTYAISTPVGSDARLTGLSR